MRTSLDNPLNSHSLALSRQQLPGQGVNSNLGAAIAAVFERKFLQYNDFNVIISLSKGAFLLKEMHLFAVNL